MNSPLQQRVSSVYLPSTWANFVYPKNPRSHQTCSGVCLTAGEPPHKHRSVWLDSIGLHSSWAATVRSCCDPYVCWFYYKPNGNQWAETHLGAHPLVISLISLLALAIWVLSPGQWLGAQRDWSGSSNRSLINGCGWGDGSFSSLFLSFFCPFAHIWYCGVMYMMFSWGVSDDWHEPPGEAGWLAGWEIVTRIGIRHGRYTQTLSFPPPKTALHPSYDGLCAVWKLNQPMILENYHQHHSLQADPVVWSIIGMLVPEWPPWEKQSIKAPHRHPVRIRVISNFKEVIQWFCTA